MLLLTDLSDSVQRVLFSRTVLESSDSVRPVHSSGYVHHAECPCLLALQGGRIAKGTCPFVFREALKDKTLLNRPSEILQEAYPVPITADKTLGTRLGRP